MYNTGSKHKLILKPRPGQFIINELPWLVLCPMGIVYGGIEGNPLADFVLAASLLLILLLAYRYVYLRRIRYYIGEEQLICEHGIFHRTINYMELYRIVDFYEHQNFMQQLFALKSVTIFSMDKQTPRLELQGLANSKDVVSIIREGVELNKQRRCIYEITNR